MSTSFQPPPLGAVSYTHLDVYKRQGGGHAGDRTAGEHGVQLLRGQPQGAHNLDDLQVLRLGFLRLQVFQLVLVLRDLLSDLCLLYTSRCV